MLRNKVSLRKPLNIKNTLACIFVGVLLAVSGISHAERAVAERLAKKVCAPCHGPAGVSLVHAYPNLAGQKKKYLINQLKAFRSGERKSPKLMNPVAGRLSDKEIKSLAKYYSGLKSCDDACAVSEK